ncbi:MAG: MFS transporter, partial [Halobacteriales archaeon]
HLIGPARRLVAGVGRFDAFLLVAAVWFLAKFLRYAVPPLFGTLQDAYGVSNAVVGGVFSALMLSYALLQFPSGALADRTGPTGVIAAGAAIAGGASLAVFLAEPFALLVVAMVGIGVGTGAHKTVAVRLLSTVYPARTGRALGALDTAGALGGVAAPAAVAALVGGTGWRVLFLAGGVAGVALAALVVRRVPRRVREAPESGRTAAADASACGYVTLFADRRFSLFVAVTVAFAFAYNGAVAFLPLYLTDAAGVSPGRAALLYSGLFAVSLVQAITGDLSDRVGRLPVMAGLLFFAGAGLALVLIAATPAVLAVAVLAFGVGGHGYRPVRGAYLVSIIPDDVAGGTLGIVRTLIMGSGAAAPAVVGYLSDVAGFDVAFGALVGVVAVALALVSVLIVAN